MCVHHQQILPRSIYLAAMTSVLITGTNRGIGLGLVKYFLNHPDPPKILIAACRNPNGATELQELKKKNSNLHILQLGKFKFLNFFTHFSFFIIYNAFFVLIII